MISDAHTQHVRMSRTTLRKVARRRIATEIDEELQRQLRRLFPALLAGYSEWVGRYDPDVWVRWHWYFDEQTSQFIVPESGITTNISLAPDPIGDHAAFARFALRRIRRMKDWQPWTMVDVMLHRAAAVAAAAVTGAPTPFLRPQDHRDGTNAWGKRALRELGELPDSKLFIQIAKIAREKFGFDTTLAAAWSRGDNQQLVIEHNHLHGWADAYEREQLELIDPRLHVMRGPSAWTARERFSENPAFWSLANAHGVRSGWVMHAEDGQAALILSRPAPHIEAAEIGMMQSNLIMLAHLAHALMKRKLRHAGPTGHPGQGTGLPASDMAIIEYLQQGRGRKEIAALAGKSIATVDRRIKIIKQKLGVEKTAQIVSIAAKIGLLPS